MTPSQAAEIFYTHDIGLLLDDKEECEIMEQNNPLLLEAYRALSKLAEKAE